MTTIDQITNSLYIIADACAASPLAVQRPEGVIKDAINHIRSEAALIGTVTAGLSADEMRPEESAILAAAAHLQLLARPADALYAAARLAEGGRADEERGRANYAASQAR